jgi:hypothetical protein
MRPGRHERDELRDFQQPTYMNWGGDTKTIGKSKKVVKFLGDRPIVM